MKWSRKMIIAVILIILIPIGYYGYRHFRKPAVRLERSTTAVRTMAVPRGSIVRTISSAGSVSGARQVNLGFNQGGQVKSLLVKRGDYVNAGAVLAEMDSSQQELALLKASNQLALAKIDGTVSLRRERELDLELAEANLAKTKITAPFSGTVIEVEIEEGEAVTANSSAITLLDNSQFYVNVTVDELDVGLLSLGQKALVTIDARKGETFSGIVADIGWLAQTSGGLVTVPVSILIEGENLDLRVGYSAAVQIETARVDNVLKLPLEAVLRQGNRSLVTVLRDGQEIQVAVETGLTDGLEVEIVSGLEANDQVLAFNFRAYGQGGMGGTMNYGGNIQRQMPSLGGFGR